MIHYDVKFIFDNDNSKHLSYYVEASDIIEAEKLAFKKLGTMGQNHKTSCEITPIVLNFTIGKPDKKYDNFKDQLADDPKIIELAGMYLRGDQKIKDEIKNKLDKMFKPLGNEYQKQAITTLKAVVGIAAIHDYMKYGKKPYLIEWLKEIEN